MSEQKMTPGELDAAIRHYQPGDTIYRDPLTRFCYTEGARFVAQQADAYWLIGSIFFAQTRPEVKAEEFQLWVLRVAPTHSAELTLDDGNGRIVYRQAIEFTDFPLAEVRLYFENQVLMLPSER